MTRDNNDLPRVDPRKADWFSRRTPISFTERKELKCEACEAETPHDCFEVMLGLWIGVGLPFFRPSTKGKVGKKHNWAFCAECGCGVPLDEASREEWLSI